MPPYEIVIFIVISLTLSFENSIFPKGGCKQKEIVKMQSFLSPSSDPNYNHKTRKQVNFGKRNSDSFT